MSTTPVVDDLKTIFHNSMPSASTTPPLTPNRKGMMRQASLSNGERQFQRENVYRVFGAKIDKRGLMLVMRFLLTLLVMSFCFYQISTRDPRESGALWAIIGTLTGFWFESPKVQNE